jgi:alanine or glycine:cation symporter, AGCS family
MSELLETIKSIQATVWGVPLLSLLIGVGVYITISLRGVQFRYLFTAFKFIKAKEKQASVGDISPFQSVMTSMASAVGTGSIVGVSTAIMAGGLGAVFWLWITVLISMAIKYAEALLAVKYRVVDERGEMAGGPMYYIERGLGWKGMASLFAAFACIAAIGTGNLVQVNSIAEALQKVYSVDALTCGIILAVITAAVLLGGIKSIGKVAAWLVPVMAIFYIFGGLFVIIRFSENLPAALSLIMSSAFTGQAAVGGFLGSTVMMAVQMGVARSVFCSEAGLGISSIAAAAARTGSSGRQAMLSMAATLLSTALICSITALVIAVTGVMGQTDHEGRLLNGATLAIQAFSAAIPGGDHFVTIGLVLFAYSTVIAWAYYGEKCFEYLFSAKSVIYYRIVYIILVIPGSVFALEMVWSFADIFNGLMVIPNMIALLALSGVIQKETNEFIRLEKEEALANELISAQEMSAVAVPVQNDTNI